MLTETRTGQEILRLLVARAGAADKKKKRVSDRAAYLRGEAMVPGHDLEVERLAPGRDNRRKRGGLLVASDALVAALAVVRDARQVPFRELHGHPMQGRRRAMRNVILAAEPADQRAMDLTRRSGDAVASRWSARGARGVQGRRRRLGTAAAWPRSAPVRVAGSSPAV